jgi:hypothetical protein
MNENLAVEPFVGKGIRFSSSVSFSIALKSGSASKVTDDSPSAKFAPTRTRLGFNQDALYGRFLWHSCFLVSYS